MDRKNLIIRLLIFFFLLVALAPAGLYVTVQIADVGGNLQAVSEWLIKARGLGISVLNIILTLIAVGAVAIVSQALLPFGFLYKRTEKEIEERLKASPPVSATLEAEKANLIGGTYILSEVGGEWDWTLTASVKLTLLSGSLDFSSKETHISVFPRNPKLLVAGNAVHAFPVYLDAFALEGQETGPDVQITKASTTLEFKGHGISTEWKDPLPEDLIADVIFIDVKSKTRLSFKTRLLIVERGARKRWSGVGNATENEIHEFDQEPRYQPTFFDRLRQSWIPFFVILTALVFSGIWLIGR